MLALCLALLLPAPAAAQSFSGQGTQLESSEPVSPDYYTVQPGDTLWDISRTFLGNPEYWPRLWSINDYITNPHWIYPGNRIAFRMGTDTEPPAVELEAPVEEQYEPEALSFEYGEAECGPDVRFTNTRETRRYTANGFLAESDDVDVYGTVYKAKTGAYWLSDGNLIYLELDDPDAFECGDVVSVFRRTQKKVKDPNVRGKKYGSAYSVVGEARIVHRVDDMVAAVVRTSYGELERGDLVGASVPVVAELEVREPNGDLAGSIVGRPLQESNLIGPGAVVFLDLGRADGVRVGDSLWSVVQRDEAVDMSDQDERLPEQVTGRVVVARVDEYTSTAVIVDANRSIEIGNRVVQKVDDR